MSNSKYTKMTSMQLTEEITKQKQRIKKINETVDLLKKLKIAAEVLEKEQNAKNVNVNNDQNQKTETHQSNIPKTAVNQPVKPQAQQTASQQSKQQPKVSGGLFANGFSNKVHK